MNVTNPRGSQSQLQVSMRQKTNVIIRIVVFSDKNKRLSFILSPLMQIFVFGSIEKEKYEFFFSFCCCSRTRVQSIQVNLSPFRYLQHSYSQWLSRFESWWALCFWYRWCLKLVCAGSNPSRANALITQLNSEAFRRCFLIKLSGFVDGRGNFILWILLTTKVLLLKNS